MHTPEKPRLTPLEQRGRIFLAAALLLLAGTLVSPMLAQGFATPAACVSALFGYGPLFLLLCFAFRGGGCTLAAIRGVLAAFGSVLLAATFLVLHPPDSQKFPDMTLGSIYSFRSLPMLGCYAFLCGVFFLSRSVRAYIRRVRTDQRDVDPFPLPARMSDRTTRSPLPPIS